MPATIALRLQREERWARVRETRPVTSFEHATLDLNLEFDPHQLAAIAKLSTATPHGFYLWGDVGRGKSMLAELYFETAPTSRKQRFHFHNFFRDLQAEIMSTRQSVEDSIRTLIGPAEMVLFDEFHVHDVADAVYLTKTLETLIEQDVFVVATSNYEPERLMPDPLFHHRFATAIALIESRFEMVPLGEGIDYRRQLTGRVRAGFGAGQWQVAPHNDDTVPSGGFGLRVNGLEVRAVSVDHNAATFTFEELCERPLGTREYLRLAEDFAGIQLIGVPDLATASPSSLMRLCNLVDVLYHRDQQFDVEALAEPERMREAFAPPHDAPRTLSRLATLELVMTNG